MKRIKLIAAIFLLANGFVFSQNGDCPGEPVCTNQTENMISGSINELNATNRGCLGANEATSSYWYQLCVSTNGTIAFSINPFGAGNDYDFAVWGPGASCPPTTPPIRCSYAATPNGGGPNGDTTGLGNGATDNSEGAGGNGWVAPINATIGQCFVININNYAGGSSNFDINFTGSAVLDCGVLPIELLHIKCESSENSVVLDWACATETNNNYFTVERSTDGVNYVELGRIQGAGNSSARTNYTYTDMTATVGTNYYRITQTDYNGQFETYGPVACEIAGQGPTQCVVYNSAGLVLFSGITNDYRSVIASLSLQPGIYVVELTKGSKRQTVKHAIIN